MKPENGFFQKTETLLLLIPYQRFILFGSASLNREMYLYEKNRKIRKT